MIVVWSEETVIALVALETTLAERFSEEKVTPMIDDLVGRVARLDSAARARRRRVRPKREPGRHVARHLGVKRS